MILSTREYVMKRAHFVIITNVLSFANSFVRTSKEIMISEIGEAYIYI